MGTGVGTRELDRLALMSVEDLEPGGVQGLERLALMAGDRRRGDARPVLGELGPWPRVTGHAGPGPYRGRVRSRARGAGEISRR